VNNGYCHYRYINNDWVVITPAIPVDTSTKISDYGNRISALETAA